MSTPLLSSALPRRVVSVLVATLFGLTLALNPVSTTAANAAVPYGVTVHALGVAQSEIGVPYRYGGTSPRTGFDCSGLTQYSYARVGRRIPRTAEQQYLATIHIPWKARRPGDLVFFFSGKTAFHVGVFAGGWTMIAAPHTGARVLREWIWSSNIRFGRVR
jgi:cell wall-associated NlpC family hydrolase